MLPTPTVSQVRAAQPASRRLRQDAGSQHTSESYITMLDIPSPAAPHHHPGSQGGSARYSKGRPRDRGHRALARCCTSLSHRQSPPVPDAHTGFTAGPHLWERAASLGGRRRPRAWGLLYTETEPAATPSTKPSPAVRFQQSQLNMCSSSPGPAPRGRDGHGPRIPSA